MHVYRAEDDTRARPRIKDEHQAREGGGWYSLQHRSPCTESRSCEGRGRSGMTGSGSGTDKSTHRHGYSVHLL